MPTHFLALWLRGTSYPVRALGFLRRHSLWRLALAPIAVNFLLLGLVLWGSVELLIPWMQQLRLWLESMTANEEVMITVIAVFTWAVWILVIPLVFVACCTLVLLLGQMVASPFLEILSEKVECIVLKREPEPFGVKRLMESLFLGVGDALWGICYLAAIYLPMLLLGFIPGIGAALSLYFGALLLSQEFLGPPLARHMVSYRARWALLMRNKSLTFGFGCATMLLVAIPGLNLVMLPVACVGGTLLFCDMSEAGLLDGVLLAPPNQMPR